MDKTDRIGCFSIVAVIVAFVTFAVICTIHNVNRPEHKIRVEYTIYRGGKPYHKTGTYTIKGDDFQVCIYTEKQKYGHGPNVFLIQDGHPWWCYLGKQSICVYTGYNDVECNSIKIIE